jgi:peptidoglycan hydrolase CwlO-like protein
MFLPRLNMISETDEIIHNLENKIIELDKDLENAYENIRKINNKLNKLETKIYNLNYKNELINKKYFIFTLISITGLLILHKLSSIQI